MPATKRNRLRTQRLSPPAGKKRRTSDIDRQRTAALQRALSRLHLFGL